MTNKKTAVWITRHGERIDFIDRYWGETAEDPYNPFLSPNGRVQAADVAKRLTGEGLKHIFSSPFRRAIETADIVARSLDLSIKIERGAGEMLKDTWFPKGDPRVWTVDQLSQWSPRIDTRYASAVDPVYPEEWEQCKVRARQTIQALVERFGGDFLIVGHGATFSSLAWGLLDDFPAFQGGCCALVKLVSNGSGKWEVELGGDASHLSYREPEYRLI